MKAIALWSACLLARPIAAAELPRAIVPHGVGVNIHFVTGHAADLDLIARGGFKFVRMDFAWGAIERQKGQYDWTGYEELLGNLEQRDLRAILILDYSNPLYEETVTSPDPIKGHPQKMIASPRHPESVAVYARWTAAAALRFHGRHVLWEIWNEPNGNFWSPKPNAQEYATLALAAARAIREADAEATIIGPASAGFPWEFLDTFLKSGVLTYLDAVSVHPYRSNRQPPETAAADYERLRGMIDSCAPPARKGKIPIVSGEWGYSTQNGGVSLETQAVFAVRQQLSNLFNNIPLSIWYDWKNDGPDPNDNEHNFGTVFADLKPKPAYQAIANLARELGNYRISRRIKLPDDKDWVLEFVGFAPGERKLAAWTAGEPHPVFVDLASSVTGGFSGAKCFGETFSPKADHGRLELDLASGPQYVTLGEVKVK